MHESELWITALFNRFLTPVGNAALSLVRLPTSEHPWANYVVMEIVAALVLMALAAVVKGQLSVDRPTRLQHVFEAVHDFLDNQSDEIMGHEGRQFLNYFLTLFLFILVANLVGVIPGLESPTLSPIVPLGCALLSFLFYNFQGIRIQGPINYAKHFAGPNPMIAPLMVVIELVSHLARPLSLTIRLFANMYAGEQVTLVFLGLTYLAFPAVFMGLHVFVSLLQAYIFTLLTMMYVGGAVAHEEAHH